jgi:hypothetical protein
MAGEKGSKESGERIMKVAFLNWVDPSWLRGWVYDVAHGSHPMIVAQDALDDAEEEGVELIENQEDIRYILEDEAMDEYDFEPGEKEK